MHNGVQPHVPFRPHRPPPPPLTRPFHSRRHKYGSRVGSKTDNGRVEPGPVTVAEPPPTAPKHKQNK